jgi:hypothetical protein
VPHHHPQLMSLTEVRSFPLLSFLLISSLTPFLIAEGGPNDNDKTIIADPLLHLLDQQLQGVHSSLLVCKWPVTLMSCFFVTLLCWDMAGDQGGWSQALWVPIVGVAMVLAIWVWDHRGSWSQHLPTLFSSCSSPCPSDHHPSPSILRPGTGQSVELVHSSLHLPDAAH